MCIEVADTNIICCASSRKSLCWSGSCDVNCSGFWSNTHWVQQEFPETQKVWDFYHLFTCFLSFYFNNWKCMFSTGTWLQKNLWGIFLGIGNVTLNLWTAAKGATQFKHMTFEHLLTLVKYIIFLADFFFQIVFLWNSSYKPVLIYYTVSSMQGKNSNKCDEM